MDPSAPVIVLTTVPISTDAVSLARTLVSERLAACVAISSDVRSVYRWKDAIEQESERQLVIKSSRARLSALEARVAQLHPYDVPEWLVVDPSGGSASYLAWLRDATTVER